MVSSTPPAPPTPPPRVVIIGGGFAGLAAAQALRHAPVVVTVLDRRNHHLFQPLLYQVATAGLSPGDIASPIRWILRRQKNVRVLLGEAQAIDPAARTVTYDAGVLAYDYLILATGATHAYFGHDDWAAVAPGLKNLDDALEIRRRVLLAFELAEREPDPAVQRELLTFVVVGGGPTGVELAGALAEIARQTLSDEFRAIHTETARIVLVEAGESILAAFPVDLRRAARRSLVRLGVELRERTAVTAIDARGVMLGAERVLARTVVWAAGVAASPLGQQLGVPLDRAGRVIVESDLSVPGHPEIFVTGDLASYTPHGGRMLPGLAPVAQQEGQHAARTIWRRVESRPPEPFVYTDYGTMATIGRNSAVADLRGFHLTGFIGWATWVFVHIARLIGFRSRLTVLVQWSSAYLTYQRSVRLITDEPRRQLGRDQPTP